MISKTPYSTINTCSVVVPCYNASRYIEKTLLSIVSQESIELKLIIVNDGSTDDTEEIIKKIGATHSFIYLKQPNNGVSAARNLGLQQAKGEYIVFFDADDVMPAHFLSSRIQQLQKNETLNFVSGEIQKFNDAGNITGYYRGIDNNAFEDILLYNKDVITCPSNYVFRTKFIRENELHFNEKLSSTADRFFLLQCANYSNYAFVPSLPKLHYRVSEHSMSHKLTKQLVADNELFYNELTSFNLIPANIKNKSLFLKNYILAVSYLKTGNLIKTLLYGTLCVIKNPVMLFKKTISE